MNKKVLTLCAGLVLAGSVNVWAEAFDDNTHARPDGYKIQKVLFTQDGVINKDDNGAVGNNNYPTVSPYAITKANGAKPISKLDNVNGTADSRYFQFVVSDDKTSNKNDRGKEVLTMVFVKDANGGQGHYEIQIENVENANIKKNRIILDRTLWKVTAEKDAAGTTLYYTLQNKATDAILQLSTSKATSLGKSTTTGFTNVEASEIALEVVAGQIDWRWAKGEEAAASETSNNDATSPVVLKDQLTAQYNNGTTLHLVKKTDGSTVSLAAILLNSTVTIPQNGLEFNGVTYSPLEFEGWEANPILLTADQINSRLGYDDYLYGESKGNFKFTFDPGVIGPDANVMAGETFKAVNGSATKGEERKPGDAADHFVRFQKGTNEYLMVDTTYYNEDVQDRYELKMAVREITFPRAAVQFGDRTDIATIQAAHNDGTLYENDNRIFSAASYAQMKRQSNFLPIFYPSTQTLKLQAEMIYKKAKNDQPWWYQVAKDMTTSGVNTLMRIAEFAQDNTINQTNTSSITSYQGTTGNTDVVNAVGYYPAAFAEVDGTMSKTIAKYAQLTYNKLFERYQAGASPVKNGYAADGAMGDATWIWNSIANVRQTRLTDDPADGNITGKEIAKIPEYRLTQAHSNVVKLVTLTTTHKVLTADMLDKNDAEYNGLLTNISIEGLRQNSDLSDIPTIDPGFYYIQNANEASTQLAKVGDYRYEDLAATNAMFTYWNQVNETWDRGVTEENGAAPTATTDMVTSLGETLKVNTGLNPDQHANDRASKGNLVYSSEKLTIPSAQWYITGNGTNYVMINRESGRQWNTEYWWATDEPDVFVNQATYTNAAGQEQTYRDTIRITPVPAAELTNPHLGYLNLSQEEVQNDTTTFAIGMTSMGDVTFSLVEEDGVLKMKQDADGKYKLERVVTKDVDTYVSAGEHFTDDLIYGYVPMLSANEADTAKMLTRAKYYIYKDDVSANTGLDEDGKGVCLRHYIVLENGQYKTKKIEVKFETVKSDEGDVLYSINRTAGEDEYTKPNNVNARRAFYIKQITPNANEYVLVDPYVVATTGNNTGTPTYGARVFVNQQTTELQPGSLVSNGYANSYANSILTIAPESAQNYFDIRREGADLDTVKIFVANNPSYLLGENSNVKDANVGLLELREVSDDICNALFVDTANLSNAACPRFLLGVRDTKKYEESNLSHHNRHLYTEAAYLVNLKDSAAHNSAYKYSNAGVNTREYYRLGFLNGTHYAYGEYKNLPGSYLVMEDGKEFNLTNLGATEFDLPVFAFRYCDATRENFYIETTYDGNQKGWIEIHNGVAVVTPEIQAAEVFSYEATEETATANETIAAEGAVSVVATDGAVIVKGAEGKNVVIATILGKVVANETINSDNETIAVPAGIAVVSVDGESFKVVVK